MAQPVQQVLGGDVFGLSGYRGRLIDEKYGTVPKDNRVRKSQIAPLSCLLYAACLVESARYILHPVSVVREKMRRDLRLS